MMALEKLKLWFERHNQRVELSHLENHMLKDIGVTREEAFKETNKWFWQA